MLYHKGIEDTVKWMDTAKPNPSSKDISTQIGVHIEEVSEFIETIGLHGDNDTNSIGIELLMKAQKALLKLAQFAKENDVFHILDSRRIDGLDALADQIVTAVGVARTNGMDIISALNEVNRSNFSKFDENGLPVLDSNRKIIKGANYSKPDLTLMV